MPCGSRRNRCRDVCGSSCRGRCGSRRDRNCETSCGDRCDDSCRSLYDDLCGYGRPKDRRREYCVTYCCSCCGHRGIFYSNCDDGMYCCSCCGHRGCCRSRGRRPRDCSVNVQASLNTGSIPLGTGIATPIIFPTVTQSEPRCRDIIYDPLTGIFRVPYGYSGNYSLSTSLTFDATAALNAVLTISFQVNGVSITSSVQNITAGTTQTFSVMNNSYLSDGNVLRLVVTSDVANVVVVPISTLNISRLN